MKKTIMDKKRKAVTVVHAAMADLDRLVPLFDAYRQFYGYPSDAAECRYFLLNRLMNEDALILLALEGDSVAVEINPQEGSLLGFAQLYPTFSSLALNQVWILNDLYVVPEHRRSGIGRMLVMYARTFLADRGDDAIVLDTAPDNLGAKALYTSIGFKRNTSFEQYVLNLP